MPEGKKAGRNNKTLTLKEVVIASGTSLSGAADIGTAELVGISMPAAWTAASITFAATIDNGANYLAVNDAAGNEVEVTAPVADKHILFSFAGIKGLNDIKLRSGTSAAGVNQGAERTVTLLLKEE